MAIICDVCGKDVTPDKSPYGDEHADDLYAIMKINGEKICLCMDCYLAISEWIKSPECKQYCQEHNAQFE